MFMYLTDFVIIGLQLGIVLLLFRWIHELLEIKRAVIRNKYTSMREVIKHGEED